MTETKEKSLLERVGGYVSNLVADVAGNPFAQIGLLLFCALWFIAGLDVGILTAGLSILAITLTQMVLYRQNEREVEAHRRDVAMHAKLDELISASKRARNDFVAVEEKEEEEIVQLKDGVKEAIEQTTSDPEVQETAKKAVEEATEDLEEEAREDGDGGRGSSETAAGGR